MAQAPTPAGQEPFPDPCNLIVNYIPTPVTDAELHAMFSQYGELVSARVIVDRATGHPKGYGFVKYKNVADANRAMMSMTGFIMHGKRLKVTPARGFQSQSIESYLSRAQPFAAPIIAPMPVVSGQPMMYMPHPSMMAHYQGPEEVNYEWSQAHSGPSFEMAPSQYGFPSPPLSMEQPAPQTNSQSGVVLSPPPSF
jgi:splicing factor 1